jgi:hypothetical protein
MPIRPALALLALVTTPLLGAPGKEVVRERRSVTVMGTVWLHSGPNAAAFMPTASPAPALVNPKRIVAPII